MLAAISLLLTLLAANESLGRPDGAPIQACDNMVPNHGVSQKPLETAAHRVTAAHTSAGYTVTISGKPGAPATPFKGFFVQARATAGGSGPLGSWDVTASKSVAKGVNCGGRLATGVTHVDRNQKNGVSLRWVPPKDLGAGKVIFVATVVQDFNNFWVGIQSEPINVAKAGPAASRVQAENRTAFSVPILVASSSPPAVLNVSLLPVTLAVSTAAPMIISTSSTTTNVLVVRGQQVGHPNDSVVGGHPVGSAMEVKPEVEVTFNPRSLTARNTTQSPIANKHSFDGSKNHLHAKEKLRSSGQSLILSPVSCFLILCRTYLQF